MSNVKTCFPHNVSRDFPWHLNGGPGDIANTADGKRDATERYAH